MDRETAGAIRGGVMRGIVTAVNDDGEMQTVDVTTHEGVERSAIEVYQPYGFSSHPPVGGTVLLFAVGGDQGDMVALPVAHPEARMGGQSAGGVALYDARGNRITIADGVLEIQGAAAVRMKVGGTVMEVTPANVSVTGSLAVSVDISDRNGPMQEMRDAYNAHQGHSTGGGPSPPMT